MQKLSSQINLYLFSFISVIIVYGFALTNFSLTPDSELPINPNYSLALGRWGTNLIRYHIFNGLYPYYTLLVGLIFLSITAVEITKLLKINDIYKYIFILLFLSFPQHAYQLVFTIQADAIGIGYFTSVLAAIVFNQLPDKINFRYIIYYIIIITLILFTISIYQALVFIPILIYAMYFFTKLDQEENHIKKLWLNALNFILILIISVILYYFSIKLIYSHIESAGYYSNYTDNKNGHIINKFFNILKTNLLGDHYYGEKTFSLVLLSVFLSFIVFIREKRNILIKSLVFVFLMIFPFAISIFTSESANPPRIYIGSALVFAFVITFILKQIKVLNTNVILFLSLIIFLWNSFYVNNLFYVSNKIYKHDIRIAESINYYIVTNFPDFNPDEDYVYFYGKTSNKQYERISLPKSEIFSGSIFRWEGGHNLRINQFFKLNDIGYYKQIDNEEEYNKIKDSIPPMPVYPAPGSIKKIGNTFVVKLGYNKGALLPFEKAQSSNKIFIAKDTLNIKKSEVKIQKNDEIIGSIDVYYQTGNEISIRGWAAYKNVPSDDTDITLVLINKDNNYVIETNREQREDVTDFLNEATNYNSSGYMAEVNISKISKGVYDLGIRVRQLSNAKDGYLLTDKKIEIK